MAVNLAGVIDRVKRNIGITFYEDCPAVRFWAPEAITVDLVYGEKIIPLEKAAFGYWEAEVNDIYPGDTYGFLLDGKNKIADPASLFQPKGVHGPSETYHTGLFKWKDAAWQNLEFSKYIIYEIHTGTFTTEGTFKGIVDKLDYLIELGITAIELMPIAQFPGVRNWGYDGVFPFAVQDSYGGPAGLQELVNACHEKGLAVVLDVVYNHLGPEGNYFSVSGPYFTDKYKTPWGSALNFDDAWSDGVKAYFIENALMWFRDFHIDALRLDAVHAIKDFGAVHLLRQIRQEVDALMKLTNRRYYLIIECDLNDNKYIDPLIQHGYGMDAQWIDEFHHALRVTAGEPATGYYSDFSGIEHLEKAYRDAYVYDGIYSSHRMKTFGNKVKENGGQQFVVFSQNHDQVGNRMLGERSCLLYSYEMQKLMAAAVLCSPFIPMLFMGEEWAETSPFQFFINHGEPELIEAVRKGRKAEFAAFQGEGAPDPQDIRTFLGSKLSWNLLNADGHKQMLQYYRALIALRIQYAPLHQTDRKQMQVSSNVSMNCLTLHRWDEAQYIVCLMNFSNVVQQVNMIAERPSWKKIFDSAEPKWKGPAAAPEYIMAMQDLTLQPQSILVYISRHV